MTTVAMAKHDLDDKKDQIKPKRFKVGKACYTCRVKKIKCDGLQPCMQCKARRRPCTFSKDGSVEQNELDLEDVHSPSPVHSRASTPPTFTAMQSRKPAVVDQKQVASTMDILNRLSKAWPGEGKEGKWELDQSKLHTSTGHDTEDGNDIGLELLPSKTVQQRYIQAYYKHCYATLPMIPKRLFFKQFESPIKHYSASYLQTPLLLLVIMAHGAQQKNSQEADIYFDHAKSILSNNGLDKPRLSTVIALSLMSIYESPENTYPTMYSSLAFQMCLDLKLMRDYTSDINTKGNMYEAEEDGGADLKELQKRVCWGCYTLDKLIHIQSGQPWLLRSKDIELDMPLLQPGDDVTEHAVLEGFVAAIKLVQIAERILQPESFQQVGQPVVRTHTHDQMSLNWDNDLTHWLRSLPTQLQWTPLLNSHHHQQQYQPPSSPPSNVLVFHLHMIYNLIELCALKPYASSTVKSIHSRCLAVANNMTHLISSFSENTTGWYYNYAIITYALIESTKFHLEDCSCENLALARSARYMFQQSMENIKKLLVSIKSPTTLSTITQFVTNLDSAINEANSNLNDVFEDDIMTPFVLGSLNARYGDEERQQWSKLDYFANGLITPPTVKSRSISMSSTMFAPPTMSSFHSYGGHSAITDSLIQPPATTATTTTVPATVTAAPAMASWKPTMTPDRFQYSTKIHTQHTNHSNNPLDFLSTATTAAGSNEWQPKKPASSVNNNHPPELLLQDQSNPSDIAALVAQIQDTNKDNESSSSRSSNEQSDWNTTNASTPVIIHSSAATPSTSSIATNENENLLYSLLSDQRTTTAANNTIIANDSTPTRRASDTKQYTTFVQPSYMNVGLGIYASAHQHHNDVIRQHLPNSNSGRTVLTHQQHQHQS